jgi:hypothetical protein
VYDALSKDELTELESLAEVGNLQMNSMLVQKTIHACRLTTARKEIQKKYLDILKSLPETQNMLDGVCEVPLLAEEVTGKESIHRFSQLLVKNASSLAVYQRKEINVSGQESLGSSASGLTLEPWSPDIGDKVRIINLEKSQQYNGLEGVVVSTIEQTTGRYGVSTMYDGQKKTLALQTKNLQLVEKGSPSDDMNKKHKGNDNGDPVSHENQTSSASSMLGKAVAILDDPEIKMMMENNPKVKDAVMDVLQNPMSFMKYLSDPELSPFISKAMSKLKF